MAFMAAFIATGVVGCAAAFMHVFFTRPCLGVFEAGLFAIFRGLHGIYNNRFAIHGNG